MQADDTQLCIAQNLLLSNYYGNKGRHPHKLLTELSKLAKGTMGVREQQVPQCQITSDGNYVVFGDPRCHP